MRVLISGSSGFVGRGLCERLAASGHEVATLVRRPLTPGDKNVFWNPDRGELDPARLEGFDAMVHLAGENVASGRWTAEKKARIRESRVEGTRLLADAIARLDRPPQVFASASATGYYGNRGDEELTESSSPGRGFLAEVCQAWEAAARPAEARGVRLALLRIGLVFDSHGGALSKMLPVFRAGLGGCLGDGRQYVSWITLDDVLSAIERVLADATLAGPINLTAPRPATNRELTKALGRVLNRPTVLSVPAFALRLIAGEMADEMLLSGARVLPGRLLDAGFTFRDNDLQSTLERLLH